MNTSRLWILKEENREGKRERERERERLMSKKKKPVTIG